MQASLNELMLNSRSLEHVLQKVVDQNRALSVSNQKVANRLYWRLTYFDPLINQASPENTERMEVSRNGILQSISLKAGAVSHPAYTLIVKKLTIVLAALKISLMVSNLE